MSFKLPRDLDSERAVLSCVMQDTVESVPKVEERGGEALFHDIRHKHIYRAALGISARMEAVDLIAMQSALRAEDVIDLCGGVVYLTEILDAVASPSTLPHYLEKVVEMYLRREVIKAADFASKAAMSGESDEMWAACASFQGISEKSQVRDRASLKDCLGEIVNDIQDAAESGGALLGVSSGIRKLDEMTMGFRKADLIVLAARPSQGKTTLAMNMVEAAVFGATPVPVGVFSLEMSQKSLLMRMVCSRAKVSQTNVSRGALNEGEMARIVKSMGVIRSAPMVIDDQSALAVEHLHTRAQAMKRKYGIGMIMVDYLQLLRSLKVGPRDRNVMVGEVSSGLKAVAKDLDVPVLVLSQLNRDIEKAKDRRPKLSDLRDSGSIEQDADVIMFIHAPSKEEEAMYQNPSAPRDVELLIEKQRNGATGSVPLRFFPAETRFEGREDNDFSDNDCGF